MILRSAKYAINLLSGSGSNGRIVFLIYHRVLTQHDWLLNLEPDVMIFEKQMRFIKNYFNPLHQSKAVELLRSGRLPPRAVCVTFDDGYADNCLAALPILEKLRVPATFYIATSFLNGGVMWNDQIIAAIRQIPDGRHDFDWLGSYHLATQEDRLIMTRAALRALKHLAPADRARHTKELMVYAGVSHDDLSGMMMSDEMVRSLSAAGMEIGAHTVSHPILSKLDDTAARDEIVASKKHLENLIDRPVQSFAYPNGRFGADFTERDVNIVTNAGFHSAVTTEWGAATVNSSPHTIPRIGIHGTKPYRLMLQMARAYRSKDPLAA